MRRSRSQAVATGQPSRRFRSFWWRTRKNRSRRRQVWSPGPKPRRGRRAGGARTTRACRSLPCQPPRIPPRSSTRSSTARGSMRKIARKSTSCTCSPSVARPTCSMPTPSASSSPPSPMFSWKRCVAPCSRPSFSRSQRQPLREIFHEATPFSKATLIVRQCESHPDRRAIERAADYLGDRVRRRVEHILIGRPSPNRWRLCLNVHLTGRSCTLAEAYSCRHVRRNIPAPFQSRHPDNIGGMVAPVGAVPSTIPAAAARRCQRTIFWRPVPGLNSPLRDRAPALYRIGAAAPISLSGTRNGIQPNDRRRPCRIAARSRSISTATPELVVVKNLSSPHSGLAAIFLACFPHVQLSSFIPRW